MCWLSLSWVISSHKDLRESTQNYQGSLSIKFVSWNLTQHIFAAEGLNPHLWYPENSNSGRSMNWALLTALQVCYTAHHCLDSAKPTQQTSRHLCMKLLSILICSWCCHYHSPIINGTTGRRWFCCKQEFLDLDHTLVCSSHVQYGNVIGAIAGFRT